MKYLGYPLIGDYLYNPDMEYMTRQALHSHHMEFTHPITGEHMSFTAPLPEDMARVCRNNSRILSEIFLQLILTIFTICDHYIFNALFF